MHQQERLMLTNPEPDRNIEELNDDEIFAAIRYLEPHPTTKGNGDNGVVMSVCLYIALLGCLAVFWLYLR
jgi:hypothetical protein